MSNKDNGGPALPVSGSQDGAGFSGISLRDHFAIESLYSIISSGKATIYLNDANRARELASLSYMLADAMMRARK